MEEGGVSASSSKEKHDKSYSGSSWEQDWIRSVGSSFSLTDDGDNGITTFLQDQLNKFDSVLYENSSPDGLIGDAAEEVKFWKHFPHLRIFGEKVKIYNGEEVEEDCFEEVIEEDDSDDDTLKEHSSDSEEETFASQRSKSSYCQQWSWYPVHTQFLPPDDILHHTHSRLSPLLNTHHSQPRIHLVESAPSVVRHGTLPPIDTLEISSKALVSRAASAKIQPGTAGFLSRPTTSRPPKVLSPICGRSSSLKRRPLIKTPNLNESDLKPVRSYNPVMWRY